jgi:hypothetical protein
MVEAAGPRIHPHLYPPHPKWLDPVGEERPQEVNLGQCLLSQLLKTLAQGLYFAEVILDRPLSPGDQGNKATIGKRMEQGGIIILLVEPFLPPPLH